MLQRRNLKEKKEAILQKEKKIEAFKEIFKTEKKIIMERFLLLSSNKNTKGKKKVAELCQFKAANYPQVKNIKSSSAQQLRINARQTCSFSTKCISLIHKFHKTSYNIM